MASREFYTKIVGVTRKNADGTRRQELIADLKKYDTIKLIPERDNPKDPNAIMVCNCIEEQLGYLSADLAEQYGPEFSEEEHPIRAEIKEITGGYDDLSYGVNLKIIELGSTEERRQAAIDANKRILNAGCFVKIIKFIILSAAALVLIPLVLGMCLAALSWLASHF